MRASTASRGGPALVGQGLDDGGELEVEPRSGHAVEAGDAEVARHAQAASTGLHHDGCGLHVALAHDRGHVGPGRQVVGGHRLCRVEVARARTDDLRVGEDVAQTGLATALRVRLLEHHGGDPAVAEVVEVLGQLAGTTAVVDVDEGRARPRRALHDDHRHVAGHQVVVRRPGLAPADVVDHRVEGEAGVLGVVAHQQQPEAGRVEDLRDRIDHRQRGRVAERRAQPAHGEADHAAAPATQVARQRVGAGVAQRGCGREDPLAGGG